MIFTEKYNSNDALNSEHTKTKYDLLSDKIVTTLFYYVQGHMLSNRGHNYF